GARSRRRGFVHSELFILCPTLRRRTASQPKPPLSMPTSRPLRLLTLLLGCLVSALAWGQVPQVTVEIEGVPELLAENVRAQLAIERERDHPLLDEYRIQRLHAQAPQEIGEALQPFGFYAPQIEATLEKSGEGQWLARYVIDPGAPVVLTRVDVKVVGAGAQESYFVQWRDHYPLLPGAVLNHDIYEEAKRELLRIGRDKGYLKGQLVRHEVRVNVAQRSATIELLYETGPRYRYGAIRTSTTLLEEELVQRYVSIRSGDYYDADRLLEMQRHLANSDYFQRADVIPAIEEANGDTVPVDIKLEMRKRTRYSIGAGYATDTGPRATLGMERRYVNDEGHRFTSDLTVSEVRNTFTSRYRIPLKKPATDSFDITARWEEETLDTSFSEKATAGVAQSRQLVYWQQTLGLSYETERYRIADTDERTTLLIPSVRWQRLLADNRIFPNKGWRVALGVKGATEEVVSDISFVQADMRGKLILPLGGGRFITRADLGTSQVAEFQQLPVSQRFFAGGDFSVRGYAYNSLGPSDASGKVVGGKHLLVGGVEYDHYFGKRFGVAAFLDAGNAFDISDYQIYKGAGAGVRWRFPFGVLRIDGAMALDDPGHDWRLHISLGPDL
ncbi:MAG TPA: autotransporter assembly complex family protein, partial [Gammaproteobacteria bacterium]